MTEREGMLGWEARRIAFEQKLRFRDNFGHWHEWDYNGATSPQELSLKNWAVEEPRKVIWLRSTTVTLLLNEKQAFNSIDEATGHGIRPDELIKMEEIRD